MKAGLAYSTRIARFRCLLAYALVGAIALQQVLAAVPRSAYRVDETGWVWAAVRVAELVRHGDFRPSAWQAEEDLGYGSINPQLGKLFFALPIIAGCVTLEEHLPRERVYWDMRLSLPENKALGAVMPPEILFPLRRVAAVLGAFLCLVCMRIVHRAAGLFAAFLSGIALAFNPLVTTVSSIVLTDISYQLGLFAAGLCAMGLTTAQAGGAARRRVVVTGLLGGLATACKYSAPFFVLPFALLMLLLSRAADAFGRRTFYASVVLLALSLVATIYATNPILWPDTSSSLEGAGKDWRLWSKGEIGLARGEAEPEWLRLMNLAHTRDSLRDGGTLLRLTPASHAEFRDVVFNGALGTAEPDVPALRPQVIMPDLFGLLRPAQLPWIYLRWAYFKEWVECDPLWLQASPARFVRNLRHSHLSYSWEFPLACLGLALLCWPQAGTRYWLAPPRALLLFVFVYGVVLYATRINDMDRYLVGIVALRCMLGGIGLAALLRLAWHLVRRATASRVHP